MRGRSFALTVSSQPKTTQLRAIAASTAPLIDCRRAKEQLLTDCAACTAELADVERSQGRGGGGGHGSR